MRKHQKPKHFDSIIGYVYPLGGGAFLRSSLIFTEEHQQRVSVDYLNNKQNLLISPFLLRPVPRQIVTKSTN
jgi:hypothetical protein